MSSYFIRVLLALDIFLNVVFGGDFETISARCGRLMVEHPRWSRTPMPVWWIEHCIKAHFSPYWRATKHG
ncbi:MAG: hypothetical protein KDK08_05685 [Rhizobiaceae bacterium]|nr:hypothetical protein [Rhizobiaceae bacterium]MCC0000959.1 hypothetical protein [Methylobacteriaceae bacterium]